MANAKRWAVYYDGHKIFSGSVRSAEVVYKACRKFMDFAGVPSDPPLLFCIDL